MPIPNGSIDLINKILAGKKIEESSDAEIQQTLLKIFVITGLRMQHYPDAMTNNFIINFIKKEYPFKTLDELYYAFELGVKQEYEFDCKVYDNFSIEYICRIMNGYRHWLSEQSKKISKKVEQKIDSIIYDKSEKLNDVNEYLNRTDITISNLYMIPIYIFEFMNELEMIDNNETAIIKRYSKATKIYENNLFKDASTLKKESLKKYNSFLKSKENDFVNLEQEIINEIENLYKRYSVYLCIVNYNKFLKEK